MIAKWLWLLRSILRRLWVRVASFAVLAIASAIAAPALSPLVPDGWAELLGGDAVDQVLTILASSMLAVTTFSLSIAVNAFTAAASSATPRAIKLLQEDHITQTTLATFLGAFVYSIVAIIGLNASYYDDGGRVVLFFSTILVTAIVVIALLRWIGYLPDFGRMENTLDRVEEAARDALSTRLESPYLGAHPDGATVPDGAYPVNCDLAGYVQHIDMGPLQEWAEEAGAQVWLAVLPGDFVHPAMAVVHVLGGEPDDAARKTFHNAFTIAADRTFDQDPRFGMIVFSEIASRALSPGINDPGTAIAVIGRQLSVLSDWRVEEGPDVHFDRLHVPSVDPDEMLDAAFRPIARDGIGQAEVLARLIAALRGLAALSPDVYADGANAIIDELDERLGSANLTERDLQQIAVARGTVQ
ncbi:DUF2254 domain-containing protein [Hasllibacter sp. MH4015]|uniref:DUF2254 domain-containing protein n=1 Tax=Hasllibacter sp. MH4015 TaxID=2854029 RepID=UPI001CD2A08A|nr:DUF2254 domain-containing protein [Hasllibacter sp. MH4015]